MAPRLLLNGVCISKSIHCPSLLLSPACREAEAPHAPRAGPAPVGAGGQLPFRSASPSAGTACSLAQPFLCGRGTLWLHQVLTGGCSWGRGLRVLGFWHTELGLASQRFMACRDMPKVALSSQQWTHTGCSVRECTLRPEAFGAGWTL